MSIFRFSAEFRFFFLLSTFLKMIFRFFWKIQKIFFFRLPIPPLYTVRRASVNSRWRLGLPVCASSVSGRCSKVPYLHSAAWAASTRRRGGWWFSGRMEDGLEVIARVLPIELQHLHPPPPPFNPHHFTHTHTHTLSLSLTHTHTPTFRAARCYYFAVSC